MTYYSRLSDIVSNRIEDLLSETSDQAQAITRIIAEIREGLTGAQRSVGAARNSVDRLVGELSERQGESEVLNTRARQQLQQGDETGARQTLLRRRECLDLAAGIEQQLVAARSTQEHMQTLHRAVEARLAEALRIDEKLRHGSLAIASVPNVTTAPLLSTVPLSTVPDHSRMKLVEDDLLALRRELGHA
ncbi:MAG TPA: hypothetical protein DDY91_08160 [Planctomycetaceae bacterium]|nr:hypothetical protein [Planctomycetaceae bacterium]